jgi:hypothetical protein
MAPCVMFLVHADPLQGQVGGGWPLEIESFFGPVKWHRADRRVLFWAKKSKFQGPTPSQCPSNAAAHIKNNYVQECINHRCIGSFVYKSPRGVKGYLREIQGPYHPSSAVK